MKKTNIMAKYQLPPLNSLRMFEVVARNNSFSLAAEELCVTHSAVSHQIKQLETWVGKKLLIRHAHGATLTLDGQALFSNCVKLFSGLDQCLEQIRQQPTQHSLTLAAPSSFMAHWLIPKLESFEAQYPEISIKLMTSNDLKLLEKHQVDMVILNHTQFEKFPDAIQNITLFQDQIGPVCTAERVQQLQHKSDIFQQTLLHTQSNQHAWEMWATQSNLDLTQAKQQRHFDHLNLMIEAAASGLGVAIAPQSLVEKELLNGRLAAPFDFIECGLLFSLCCQKTRLKDENIQIFKRWLLTQVE
ncbi:LysR substrate-binding domain-containing protein [Acinetobacter defluvii]|uniref:LysR substrate-binding domain-containing protein n=1 Tax=Acinetobacter defluvii TaxID=1871111 RepID=UPI00148EFB17|nr:LysR substrate-binding domain-containing protein [Acinetobacter defluvii]